ncbi:unnamed protein product [Kluyveromyces dobzhanskii CBS 2104]|uniref:WGS project CCBQ000000000 data, contig 00015 n=1 Tax=Kluyveromyces dobzhanskii CBS 2104 TaxID=1427455 RepID=A0A0A8LCB3_9SACH|nr:unnamed protein product [Kluyveromyces dobzhanskii CBS 2104]
MPFLLPSNCSCYNLHLPQLDPQLAATMDECTIRRSTLDVRTGAATVLARSGIFVHGGLTIPLNLHEITSTNLQQELIMHFARERKDSSRFQNLGQWISKEVFFLDLISRSWERVETMPETDYNGNLTQGLSERLFHSVCYCQEAIYVFGGLTVSTQSDYEFISTNELWKLDLHNKVWSLVSADPSVTRRFNNQMHVLYETDAEKDTKLIIVGGLNNFDQPVETIDVYNLTADCWESDLWDDEDELHNITVNVKGKPIPLISENNFSLLVEENEAKLPSLAVYSPSEEQPHHDHATGSRHGFKCNFNSEENPLFALPLMPDAEGARMYVFDDNDSRRKRLHIAYNLQWPTGEKFGYNIIIAGFHPNLQSDNFHCFLYNISSGKWTRLSINCDDLHSSKHRFWKLFLWESHHKALLLGTKNDAGSLPSVQKFDRILSFGLHITNLFHSAKRDVRVSRTSSAKKFQGTVAQTETDQFENYSRYVAPPSEITSIRSVFPSYSMVLGKDSLEVYNKLLADFEFITEDNESVAVPSFLLRKRWGRYFDKLLANAYVQVSTDSKISETYSQMAKMSSGNAGQSPHTSNSINSMSKDEKKATSQGSLDTFFSRHRPSTQSVQSNTPPIDRKSACLFFNPPNTDRSAEDNSAHSISALSDSSTSGNTVADRQQTSIAINPNTTVSLDEIAEQTSSRRHSNAASGVTSSSGGMVFRVPFRLSGESSKKSTPPPISLDPNDISEPIRIAAPSYRKNSASSFPAGFTEDYPRYGQSRKVSQSLGNENILHSGYGFNSPLSSRKASTASASSSISHVSSSSDRMGESVYRSPGSEEVLTLNFALPPLEPVPSDPLPPLPNHPPHDFNLSKRLSDHFGAEVRYRTSTSPLSSRRSSLHHDISHHLSQENVYPNRIDEIFVGGPLHKPEMETDGVITPQNERLSVASNSESMNSQNMNPVDVEFEPLFIPRSLYMPWPTETVKAFSEFFYTGQIDGKWPLSPVAVGLLNMAKIYEVPLLFDLMLEVFYSIIGKKEESLFVTSKAIQDSYLNRVSLLFDDDQTAIQEYLDNNKNYQEYTEIKKSLNSIDDGYIDVNHLRKASAAFSVSTASSNATQDRVGKSGSQDFSSSPALSPSVTTGSPRDSVNSISSMHYPSTMSFSPSGKKSSISHIQQRINPSVKHKSSLSKEVSAADSPISTTRSSSPIRPTFSNIEMHTIDDELDEVTDILEQGTLEKSNSNDSTGSSDSDDLGVGLGIPSKSKIEKSFRERALELEESIDPLSRGSTEFGFSHPKKHSLLSNISKDDPSYHNQKLATLDSLASPNSLPPVDYVMELIYESAVLVSDVKLMVRCMDCLHISKEIKSLKRKFSLEMAEIDDILTRQRKVSLSRPITRPESHEQSPNLQPQSQPQPQPSPSLPSHPSSSSNHKSFDKVTRTISSLTIGSGRSKTNQSSKP